jgi:hypothetical protein
MSVHTYTQTHKCTLLPKAVPYPLTHIDTGTHACTHIHTQVHTASKSSVLSSHPHTGTQTCTHTHSYTHNHSHRHAHAHNHSRTSMCPTLRTCSTRHDPFWSLQGLWGWPVQRRGWRVISTRYEKGTEKIRTTQAVKNTPHIDCGGRRCKGVAGEQ